MRKDIQERVETIKSGEIPVGYKKSKIGIIPEEWENVKFNELLDEKKERTNDIKSYPLYSLTLEEGITEKSDRYDREHLVKKEASAYKVVHPGEFAYNPMNIRFGAVACNKTNKAVSVSGYYDIFEVKCISDKEFLESFLTSSQMIKHYNRVCTGSLEEKKRVHFSDFLLFDLPLPPAKEREYISKVLTICDNKIELVKKKMDETISIKTWIIQNYLTGKRRLKGFEKKWEKVRIGEFIYEVDERTQSNNEYNILSVTKKGICLQSEHFNKQIASDDTTGYKIVHKGNLVFSTMNLWMGSLDVLDKYEMGIVSPAYKIFDFDERKMLSDFGKYYMKTDRMIWKYNINSEQGASVVRKNLDLQGLLADIVSIPSLDEQKILVNILKVIDMKIELLEKKFKLVKNEKESLMQLLFSGIVRVNDV